MISASNRLSRDFAPVHDVRGAEVIPFRPDENPKWSAPTGSSIKINCDGAYSVTACRGGIGIVGRNNKGEFLRGWATHISADSAFHAELQALTTAIVFADFWKDSPIIIETDCKVLFQAV